MIRFKQPAIEIEEVTDPAELAKARAQDERFERNWAWLDAHAAEIYAQHRGKCVCVAGQELFVADTPEGILNPGRYNEFSRPAVTESRTSGSYAHSCTV